MPSGHVDTVIDIRSRLKAGHYRTPNKGNKTREEQLEEITIRRDRVVSALSRFDEGLTATEKQDLIGHKQELTARQTKVHAKAANDTRKKLDFGTSAQRKESRKEVSYVKDLTEDEKTMATVFSYMTAIVKIERQVETHTLLQAAAAG
jgi:hypothetical protein